jgi:hypothetical protein
MDGAFPQGEMAMFDRPEDANRSVCFVLDDDETLGRLMTPVDSFVRFALDMERRNGEFLLRFSHLGAPMTLARRCAASMIAKKVD